MSRDKIVYNEAVFNRWYEAGRVPSVQVQAYFTEERGLPMTTFQFSVKNGSFPAPTEKQGKFRFYDRDTFDKLKKLWAIIRSLKESSKIETIRLGKILKKHKHSDTVVDLLLKMVHGYPLYKSPSQAPDEWFFQWDNQELWLQVLGRLEDSVPRRLLLFAR